jgi:acetyl-CoA C-acetyltransferase
MSAPIPTVQKLWKILGRDGEKDYDLYEHNEAFASACLGVMQELGLKHEKLNVHGGAVAMGHPLGASGCRIVLALIHALRRKGGKRGFATACLGGGMATAIEVEV